MVLLLERVKAEVVVQVKVDNRVGHKGRIRFRFRVWRKVTHGVRGRDRMWGMPAAQHPQMHKTENSAATTPPALPPESSPPPFDKSRCKG